MLIQFYIPTRFKPRRLTWREFFRPKGKLLFFPSFQTEGNTIDKRRFAGWDLTGPDEPSTKRTNR